MKITVLSGEVHFHLRCQVSRASQDDATQIETILIVFHRPRKPRQVYPQLLMREFLQQFADLNAAYITLNLSQM